MMLKLHAKRKGAFASLSSALLLLLLAVDGFSPQPPNPRASRTRLLGRRCRDQRKRSAAFVELDPLSVRAASDLEEKGQGSFWNRVHDIVDLVEEKHHLYKNLKRERRRKKQMKILYVLGGIFTFPIGPLIFLAIRNRRFVLQDLGVASSVAPDEMGTTSNVANVAELQSLFRDSASVEAALAKSTDALQQVRDDLEFSTSLMQTLDQQAEDLLGETLQSLSAKNQTVFAERETLLANKSELAQKANRSLKQVRILEDSVRSLQTRSMELNSQIRRDRKSVV